MRNTTQGAALLAALAFSGLVATGAAAQSYDRYDGRSSGSASIDDRQQERYGRSDSDRYLRDEYERGYRMGRDDERRARAVRSGSQPGSGQQEMSSGWGGQSASAGDDQGLLILLIERDRQQQAMRDIRQSLQEARTALQQDDRARAQTALDQADQTLRQTNALQNQQQIERSLTQAEQALQRGDRQAAQQALQQARQATRGSAGQGGSDGHQQARQQQTGEPASSGGSGQSGR